MATIVIDKTLDVIAKYNNLVTESLDTESVYIRTKETLLELFNAGSFTGQEKARVIAEVLGNLNSTLVNASMSTALEWAKAEKGNEFQKIELGYKLDVIEQQALGEEAKVKQILADIMVTTATSRRQNGVSTVDPNTGFTIGLSSEGKVWKEMQLLDQEVLNKAAEKDVLVSKLKESQAAIYKIVADTVANFGAGTYVLGDTGVTSFVGNSNDTLSYYQKEIAKQQAKGYVYNAWSNAVNASATTLGLLVAENKGDVLVDNLKTSMLRGINSLAGSSTVDTGATPSAV